MSLIDYTLTKRPIYDIDLDAAPYDRWQEVGRRSKVRLGRFLRDIGNMCEEFVDAVVDTTGAGDLYAAGVLYGLSRGLSLAECGRLGCAAAGEAIGHFGARPQADLKTFLQA